MLKFYGDSKGKCVTGRMYIVGLINNFDVEYIAYFIISERM